jgi:ADP-ribose pyrophosphatase YjhB (NUDIX family)
MERCGVHRLVADVAALSGGKVLLVKYKDPAKYDGQRGWFLPDDYLAFEEHPGAAAQRILREQAGITAKPETLSHIESFAGGPEGAWHLIFHYKVELSKAPAVAPGANVADARWFPVGKLPPKKDVAHGGWALDVLREVLAK